MGEAAAAAPGHVEPDWLRQARDRAKQLSSELALPTAKEKGWEFTDLAGLDLDAHTEALASVEGLPSSAPNGAGASGPLVLPLAEATSTHGELVRERLGRLARATDVFVARNEARWRDGVFVYVPRGTATPRAGAPSGHRGSRRRDRVAGPDRARRGGRGGGLGALLVRG